MSGTQSVESEPVKPSGNHGVAQSREPSLEPDVSARPSERKPQVHRGWLCATLVLIAATVVLTTPTGGVCIDYADAPGTCQTFNLIGADPVWPWQLAGFALVVWCACKSKPSER